MYRWKNAFIMTAFVKELDSSGVLSVVKCPKELGDGDDTKSQNLKALEVAINQQRIKAFGQTKSHELPEGEAEYVPADSRLWFIPRLGYLTINKAVQGVECNDGNKRNAVVATRKLGRKVSSFYLFQSDYNKSIFSGSLGRMYFRLEQRDGSTWVLTITSYR